MLSVDSLLTEIDNIPQDLRGQVKEIDYEVACKLYSDYWSTYTNSYIPDIGQKFEISIEKLETPP